MSFCHTKGKENFSKPKDSYGAKLTKIRVQCRKLVKQNARPTQGKTPTGSDGAPKPPVKAVKRLQRKPPSIPNRGGAKRIYQEVNDTSGQSIVEEMLKCKVLQHFLAFLE